MRRRTAESRAALSAPGAVGFAALVLGLGGPAGVGATPAASASATPPASAAAAAPPSDAAAAEAARHFDRARAAYQQGDYQGAAAELEHAVRLDPEDADLLFNLSLVYEKLGDLDRAIEYQRRLAHAVSDPDERARAERTLVRLEGARGTPRQRSPARAAARARAGKSDPWFLAASGVAIAGALVGAVYGYRALSTAPGSDGTGAGRSAEEVRRDQRQAHDYAVVADVAFAIAIGAGAGAFALHVARPTGGGSATLGATWRAAF